MNPSLWETLDGKNYITNLRVQAWRIVEDQAKSSTRKLVDTLQEHDILEQELENSKPKILFVNSKLHYLLSTPFRYPPLRHGSRFGYRHEMSLFYGALEFTTALAEKAYYRMLFLRESLATLGEKPITMTSFQINVNTKKGVDLTLHPFDAYKNEISSPNSYSSSQPLGAAMRQHGIEAFTAFSARSLKNGKNIGLFSPQAFDKNNDPEKSFKSWFCYPTKDFVEFSPKLGQASETIVFHAKDFMEGEVYHTNALTA